jgi:hypothetical protein
LLSGDIDAVLATILGVSTEGARGGQDGARAYALEARAHSVLGYWIKPEYAALRQAIPGTEVEK